MRLESVLRVTKQERMKTQKKTNNEQLEKEAKNGVSCDAEYLNRQGGETSTLEML